METAMPFTREPTYLEKQLLIEVACYFSEKAVGERGQDDKAADLLENVAEIIANWKPEEH